MPVIASGITIGAGVTIAATPSLPTANLALRLDATESSSYSGSGTTWTDISGNGRNFTWQSAPSYTSAGNSSYFSTLNNLAVGPASNSFGIDNTSGYTIVLVSMQNSLANSGAFKFYGTVGYSRGIFSHCTWSNDRVYFDQGGCCAADTRTEEASYGSQVWVCWTFRRITAGSTRTIFRNGIPIANNTAAAANIDLNTTASNLGGASDEYGGNASTWDARLGAFLVYNTGLTDSQVMTVYQALKPKWGLV